MFKKIAYLSASFVFLSSAVSSQITVVDGYLSEGATESSSATFTLQSVIVDGLSENEQVGASFVVLSGLATQEVCVDSSCQPSSIEDWHLFDY
ncbi:MAG: hypothetical protein SFY68_14005 [Candidatus Sumerlaeia bacterium]|nr:hypothetical protein [Candidatus Sumerlaeia bacterium]